MREFENFLTHKALDRKLRYVMTRLLGRQVVETAVSAAALDQEAAAQNDEVIQVMDVRKYSALSKHRTPQKLFELLNPMFKILHEESDRADGTILEFVGDCLIIVWNTFPHQQTPMTDILFCTMRALRGLRVHNALSAQADRKFWLEPDCIATRSP